MRYELVSFGGKFYVKESGRHQTDVYHRPRYGRTWALRKKVIGSRESWAADSLIKKYCGMNQEDAQSLFDILVEEDKQRRARTAAEHLYRLAKRNHILHKVYDSAEIQVQPEQGPT